MENEEIIEKLEKMEERIEELAKKFKVGDKSYSRAVRVLDEITGELNSEDFLDKIVARIRNKQL